MPDFESRFFFVGERLAVDLLNTAAARDGVPVELLETAADLAAWAEAAGIAGGSEVAWLRRKAGETAPRALRAFRERLRGYLLQWREGRADFQAVAGYLNRYLGRDLRTAVVRARGTGAEIEWRSAGDPLARLYGAVALSAAQMLAHDDRARLRNCANPICRLMFYDTSKSGRRRWCSMGMCGAQAKVRAHYWRNREAER